MDGLCIDTAFQIVNGLLTIANCKEMRYLLGIFDEVESRTRRYFVDRHWSRLL